MHATVGTLAPAAQRSACAARADSADSQSRAVTIYDVALMAGVSPSTVSRTFARPGRVGNDTAEHVRQIAASLGYRAHPMIRPDAASRTSIIAVLVSDATNPFYDSILAGAEAAAADADYVTVLINTHGSAEIERAALARILPVVDGIVLATTLMLDSAIRMIAKERPVVVLNRAVAGVPSIVTDTLLGVRHVVQHLTRLWHRSITYVGGPEASWTDGVRWRSLREVAAEFELQTRRIGPFEPTHAGGIDAAEEIGQRLPTTVLTFNDRMAIGLVHELAARGMTTPGDISIVGFDNIAAGNLVAPPLTTVEAPLFAMGRTSVQHLIAVLRGACAHTSDPVVLPTHLVVKGTTGHRRNIARLPAGRRSLSARPAVDALA